MEYYHKEKSPMQAACPGSGSHSPLPIHTDAFGPVRMNPGRQEYMIDCPSVLGMSDSSSMFTTTGSCSVFVRG